MGEGEKQASHCDVEGYFVLAEGVGGCGLGKGSTAGAGAEAGPAVGGEEIAVG